MLVKTRSRSLNKAIKIVLVSKNLISELIMGLQKVKS